MRLDEITANQVKSKGRRRVGRGSGSGRGTTAGRGTKGQKARSGGSIPARFEGGQNPLMKRIPKRKGFRQPKRLKVLAINLHHLHHFLDNGKLTLATLRERGYLRDGEMVKILGANNFKDKVEVEVHKISRSARDKIESAGGKVIIVEE